MEPIIEFKDFTFKYKSQKEPTLLNINLQIMPGEKVLIVGPSGSGKSTLANCLNALVPFSYPGESTGTLTICGEDPAKAGIFGMSKHVGTVLQDTDGQFIGLTVGEDIAFSLENDMVPWQEMHDRVDEVAKWVEVDTLLRHAPGALSGGQKQRVSMAGVLIDKVEILLFDEPLANLDPAAGKNAIALIDKIHKESETTIIIIEHRLEDALSSGADRIILVDEGRILADMTPNELLATDLLTKQGIREPLYITALKYAGCELSPEANLSDLSKLDMTPYKEKVQKWFESTPVPPVREPGSEVLKIDDISFSYEKGKKAVNVLNNISLTIHKGEMLSIVGKNGAGKSTLSSLICGFNKPGSGMIYLNGEDISPLSIKERGDKIGMVMQSPNQMISKPMIYDEVALGLVSRGVDEETVKERVYKTLKICGLYPFRNWPISALSFGQKKRVTIASILCMDPEIMFLDEPTAGQDYRHYTEIMEFLKQVNEELGITVIMITHDMHLMLEYTHRAIVLAEGHLLADDTPARILTNEEMADKASLKKTSLYDLALACDIDEPDEFVERFIHYEQLLQEKEDGK